MAAVLLLLLSALTGATGFSSMNFLSGLKPVDMPEDSFGCPLGQMYCFRTNRCVNRVDKSCPGIPNCPANEVVCNVGGNLECVEAGTCEKIDVKFKIQKSYDQVVGVKHGKITAFMDNIRQKFAVKLGRAASEFWGVEVHPGENAVWVTLNSVPDAEADLNSIFKNEKQQFLTDQDGIDLIIDFTQGFISKDCGTGQICWQTEAAQCVPEYQCPTYLVEVTMDGDYGSTVGMDEEGFKRNLVSQLSNGLNVRSEAFEYPNVHPGSIVFDFQTSLTDIQQRVQDLIDNGHFPKDLSGNLLTVMGLTATLITGDVVRVTNDAGVAESLKYGSYEFKRVDGNSGSGPGDWKFDWDMPNNEKDDYCIPGECTRCQPGEQFCFMSQMCIKADGTCATKDQCEATEEPCWDPFTGDPYCMAVGMCTVVDMQATFTVEGDCTATEPVNVFKDLLRTQLAAELQISESEITNLVITCEPIDVTFEIHGGSPAALSAALYALKALVDSEEPLLVGADTYPILPTSLQLGNCERDSEGHCMEQCPAPEVPCWDDVSGQPFCELEALCVTTIMKVSFHMDGDMATVDLGTDVFKLSLKTALAGLLSIVEDVIPYLEVLLSDDGSRLVVQFQVENTLPSELDRLLRNIKDVVEPGGSLNINGYDYEIVPGTLHFGIDSDCPRDSSGNCVHMPDDCPDTEVECWLPDGTFYCDFEGSCTETTMPASLLLDGDTSFVDLGTDVFKMSLQTELAGQLGISEAALLNFEVSLRADSALEVNFLVESSSPGELNTVLKNIKGIADGSQSLTVNGIEYWITTVHFGTSTDCPKDGSGNCAPPPYNCPATEEGCWDPFTGEPYCMAAGMCTEAALLAKFTLEGDCTAIEPEDVFKDSLRAQLAMELKISESEITNLEIACGSIDVTFEIHGGSSAALSAALYALKALVESEGPLQVGADTYPILPMSLRLGNCERDSEGHCMNMPEQCQAPEVPCWNDVSGETYCEAEALCITTSMKVSFHMDGDITTVDLGTDVFKLSLKTALAGLFGIIEDAIPYLEVFLIDDGTLLVVKLQVENIIPAELDSVLRNIKAIVEPGAQLNVNGYDYGIISDTLHFGTDSDCPRDSSGNCVHAPDDCPATEVTCWYADGTPYCDSEGSCTVTTMPASLLLDGDTSFVDLGTDVFKMSLQTELAGQLGISEAALLNFEVSLRADSALEVNFLVESSSPGELNTVLKNIKGIADGSQSLTVNGIEYWITTVHFGTSTDCPKDGSGNCAPPPYNCPATEEGCWDPFTGEPYCMAAGMCTEAALLAKFTLEGDCTAIEPEDVFKDSLRAQLAMELKISESEITNLEIACGSIDVTFEIHGGSSAALSAALYALKALVESEGPLQVGADTYPILPMSLRLGNCERDSEGHCMNMPEQCQAPEVPCWNDVSGETYCEAEALCITTSMKVSFHMDGDITTVDLGTDVFKLSLKTALAGLFGIIEDAIPYLEVFLSDDGTLLVVKLQVENIIPAELDIVLRNIKAIVEPGAQLNVNGYDYGIISDTLHFGTDSDCPRDSSGNCVHAPDDCPATEVTCWYADGTPYCDSEGSCTITTMPVFFGLAGDTTSVDLGTDSFKLILQTTLAGQLGTAETVFLNFEVSLSGDGALEVHFDVESSSANELDGILKGIKGIADGSQSLTVNGIEYWMIVLHFGTSTEDKEKDRICSLYPERCNPDSEEFKDKCPNATSSLCVKAVGYTKDCGFLKPCEEDEICCRSHCGTVCHKLQEKSDPPGGACPDPDSALFTWSCDAVCTAGDQASCRQGTLCCYSNACQSNVCVAPDGATAPDGICPASNSPLLTGSGICSNAKTCISHSECGDSGEDICCYSDECGDQICIEQPNEGSGWDHSGSGSGWELPHFGSGSGSVDGCAEGENCKQCPLGQVICFMTGTCVDVDGPCKDEDPSSDCTTNEDVCWDQLTGTKGCVPKDACGTTSIRAEIVFDSDMSSISNLESFKVGLPAALATKLQIKPESVHLLEIKAGSIIGLFEVFGESPEDLNDILSKLEHMIEEGGVLDVLGTQLPFSAGALKLGGPIDCAHTDSSGNCIECVSPEMWCPDQLMCKTDCTPEPELDVFYVSLEPASAFDYFAASGVAGSFMTDVTQDMVRSRLEQLEEIVRRQLKFLFSDMGAEIHRVTALPTRTEEEDRHAILWARISAVKGFLTLDNLENKLSALQLNDLEGNSMTFTSAVYQLPDEPISVLIVPQPFVAGNEMDLDIGEIIPQSMREKLPAAIRESFPSQASITCEQDTNVFFLQPGSTAEVQAVTLDATTTNIVKLIHRNQDIELVSCSVTFSELETSSQVTKQYKLGLLAVPDEIQKLAQPGAITLAQTMIELDEDSDCQTLPDKLFNIEIPGDGLVRKFDHYAKNMIENGEKWVGDDLSQTIRSLLADYVVNRKRSLALAKHAYIKISEHTLYTENNKMVAKLRWKQGLQDAELTQDGKGSKTDLLATRNNLKMCVKEDYNGEFILEITPADLHKQFDTLQLPVLVSPMNDAPVVKEDLTAILTSLDIAYPRVKRNDDPDITPPEISATELARQLFSDQKDKNDNIGLVLLGTIMKPNDVGGNWEYKLNAGADWMPVLEFSRPNLDGATDIPVPVVHLGLESMLRFTLDSAYESKTWKRSEGPGIKFAGLDLTLDLDPNLGDTMMLHFCEPGSKKLCGQGGTTVWSEAIVDFQLPRYGCDGRIDSGSELLNEACDCDEETCPDCKGVDGGDADWDKCGICAAPGEALTRDDCCLPEHRDEVDESWKEYCDEQDRIAEELKCPTEGEVKNLCGDCVATGSDLSGRDECDVPCGDNTKCADCSGQPNGDAMINPCGECKSEAVLYEGCNIGMKHEPKLSYVWPTSHVWLAVTEALSTTPIADISCSLTAIEGAPVVPEVTSVEFETSDSSGSTNGNIIKLTLTVSETEAENSAGNYDISCEFGSTLVKISDNNEKYTRLTHPILEDLSPATAVIDDAEIMVTIYGAGFVDTGKLFCVIPCSDLKMYNCRKSADGRAYYTTPGEYVDESTVKCDYSWLQKFGRGGTVNINVILEEESMVDMARLPSPLTFTVKMPPPNLVSAVLDDMGCNSINVGFDKYIKASIGRVGPCSQFFTAAGATIPSGVICHLKGKMIEMEFNDGASMLPAGTVLSLVDNVIYDSWVAGDDANNLARMFATGTVTVAEPVEMIQPDVTIVGPEKVGNQPDYLKVKILDRGCLRFNLDWLAEAVNPDSSNTELTNKVTALNIYLQGLEFKRWVMIRADQLVSGEEFRFTLTWSAKQYSSISGIITHTISQDDTKQITAEITGLQDKKVDIREPLKLAAFAQMNTDQFSEDVDSFYYEWTVLPSIGRNLRSRPWLWLPAYSLKADISYTVKLKVSYGDISHETKITFQTLSNPLIARINGDDEEELMWPLNKDLILTAAESEDPDRSPELDVFTWTCKTNLGIENAEDVDSFRPCMELDENDNPIPVERQGETVDLLAAERNSQTESWELWTLRWQKGTRSSKTQKLIKFEEVPSVPKIILRTKKLTVGTNSKKKTYRIRAYCKAKTGHIWRGDQGKDYSELDVSAVAKFPGQIEKEYGSNSDTNRYQICHLTLDFSKPEAAEFITGETYKLTVTAYSEYLSSKPSDKSASVIIETWTNPVAGTVEVLPADPTISSYEAMKTKFQMYLNDWWDPRDGVNLKCRYFYKASGSEYQSVDHKYQPMDKPPIFTLPEGTFTFKATCCNTEDLCESATSADTITVEPVDIATEEATGDILKQVKIAVKAVSTALQALTNLIRYASQIAPTASTVYRDEVKQTLKTEVNTAILNTVPEDDTESDVEETVGSVKKSVAMLKEYNKPSEISRAVAMRLMLAALGASRKFTGGSGSTSKRRRKRGVSDPEDSDGMTKTEAEDMLSAFDMCGGDSDAFEDLLDEALADGLKETIDNVMQGLCTGYNEDGSTAWNAVKELVTVQLKKHSLQGVGSAVSDVVDSPYTEAALITYGDDLAGEYDDSWECSNETAPCTDVCIATAQLGVDIITMTASVEITSLIRQSDLVITKLINPEKTTEELIAENLVNPIVVTIQTYANDLTDFDLLCMMWIDEDWSDSTCTTGVPTPGTTTYQVECSCSQTGILGVFQTEKSNTSVVIGIITTTAPNVQKPSKQLKPNTVSTTCKFTLNEDYDAQLAMSSQAELEDHFKQSLVDQTGYGGSIRNVRIEKGSIVVIFELHPSSTPGSDTLGQMLASIESMVQSGTLVLTNPNGDTLTILTNSFTYEEQSSGDDDDKSTSALPYILGGVLGGLAIIGLFVVLTVIAVKKTRGNRTRPNTPVSPAPAYENAKPMYPHALPPPYSALSTPSKDKLYPDVEKWTENELKVAHPDTKKAPRSTGSASSTERRLILNLEEERQPTPVDN